MRPSTSSLPTWIRATGLAASLAACALAHGQSDADAKLKSVPGAPVTLNFVNDTTNGAFQVAVVGIADDDLQIMGDFVTSETTY